MDYAYRCAYPATSCQWPVLQVVFKEKRQSFTHFLTNVCAIVGGVFTVSGLIDAFIYHGSKVGCLALTPSACRWTADLGMWFVCRQ